MTAYLDAFLGLTSYYSEDESSAGFTAFLGWGFPFTTFGFSYYYDDDSTTGLTVFLATTAGFLTSSSEEDDRFFKACFACLASFFVTTAGFLGATISSSLSSD